jgi:hypothetical protein
LHPGREETTAPQVLGAAATAAKCALSPQQLSQKRIGRTASGQVVPVTPMGGEQGVPINLQMAGQRNRHQFLSQAGVHGPCQSATREELKQTLLEGANENRGPGECRLRRCVGWILRCHDSRLLPAR